MSEELRRSRPTAPETYHLVGEIWEGAGELDQPNPWLTRGVLLAVSAGAQMDWATLLIGRLRVRRALGFPPDDYDRAGLDMLQESRTERGRDDEDVTAAPTHTQAVVSRAGGHTHHRPLLTRQPHP